MEMLNSIEPLYSPDELLSFFFIYSTAGANHVVFYPTLKVRQRKNLMLLKSPGF